VPDKAFHHCLSVTTIICRPRPLASPQAGHRRSVEVPPVGLAKLLGTSLRGLGLRPARRRLALLQLLLLLCVSLLQLLRLLLVFLFGLLFSAFIHVLLRQTLMVPLLLLLKLLPFLVLPLLELLLLLLIFLVRLRIPGRRSRMAFHRWKIVGMVRGPAAARAILFITRTRPRLSGSPIRGRMVGPPASRAGTAPPRNSPGRAVAATGGLP